ncbi:MAG: hypothetical protein LC745_04080, partial [Planctomycetia bacterium]|nr:hypothetical protein [Planctomycetia bacterium]
PKEPVETPETSARPLASPGGPEAGGQGIAGTGELAAELERLERDFAGLGDRLAATGESLRSGALPPGEDLAALFDNAREGFARLCRLAEDAARYYAVTRPEGGFTSLNDLAALLPSLGRAEAEFSGAEAIRRQALHVLDRVERLGCPGDPTFAPLAGCRESSGALRTVIAGAGPGRTPDVVRELAEGGHPLSTLLHLIDADDATSDALWADRYDAVVAAFGHPLAVAAARSRIVPTDS